jgi:hypothetical protein
VRRHMISGPSEYNKNSGMINTRADRIQFQILEAKLNSNLLPMRKILHTQGRHTDQIHLGPLFYGFERSCSWLILCFINANLRVNLKNLRAAVARSAPADSVCRSKRPQPEVRTSTAGKVMSTMSPSSATRKIQRLTSEMCRFKRRQVTETVVVATQGGPSRAPNQEVPAPPMAELPTRFVLATTRCSRWWNLETFFFVWLNKGRTERTCDREIGGRVVNADF